MSYHRKTNMTPIPELQGIACGPASTPTKPEGLPEGMVVGERGCGPVPYIEYDPETDPDYPERVASPTPTKAATAEGQGEAWADEITDAQLEDLISLIERAQQCVPEFYVNWHQAARDVLANLPGGRDAS